MNELFVEIHLGAEGLEIALKNKISSNLTFNPIRERKKRKMSRLMSLHFHFFAYFAISFAFQWYLFIKI